VYTFKHILTQEVAYQSLVRRARQQYHTRIAQALESQFQEVAETQPELLAHHYTEAGRGAQAIPYWHRAGQRAVERSANVEAISHFTKGLELLKALPDTPERVQRELTLQLALGPPLLMLKGHTAPEVEYTYTQAYTLAQQLGETPQRFSVLVGLQRFYLSQARFHTARELAEQCFVLAQHLGEPASLQEAHTYLGSALFFLGDLVAAHAHLEQGIALYDLQQSRQLAFSRGTDPGVVCLAAVAWALWWLGYPDRALARSHEAIALAQQLAYPYSLVFALQYNARLHMWRRETALVKAQAEAAMALMQEHGLVNFLGGAMVILGRVLVEQGAVAEGIEQIRRGLDLHGIHGIKLGLFENLAILAQAYGRAGQAQEGLRVLAEATAAAHNSGESYGEAELYRLKGELLWQAGMAGAEEVGACFRQALDIARHQQAKSLELRAALSIVHLWQCQGKQAAARQMLAESYSWFTEGFDTPDLQEAQALLAALQ
jgi:tetratricopeptide (TPR) repeat protein